VAFLRDGEPLRCNEELGTKTYTVLNETNAVVGTLD
jgi:hypothetical protein